MSTLPDYVYQKLTDDRDIRILVLYPSKRMTDPLLVDLQHRPWIPESFSAGDNLEVRHIVTTWEFLRARARLDLETNKALSIPSKSSKYGQSNEKYERTTQQLIPCQKNYCHLDFQQHERDFAAWNAATSHYEAVSYAWGQEIGTVPLTVGTKNKRETSLQVRKNVDTMLRYLRHRDRPRYLWIDAICINQIDNVEKAAQVRAMGSIYERAKTVLIWLGRSGHLRTGGRVIKFLRSITAHDAPVDIQIKAIRSLSESSMRPLQQFLNRPWFTRRWIIQEVTLARRPLMLCETEIISFDQFVTALNTVYIKWNENSAIEPSIPRTLLMIQKLRVSRSTTDFKLLQLLATFESAQCFDDRDRLYALRDISDTQIDVSYSIAIEKLYSDVAESEAKEDPELLSFSGAFRSYKDMPSWIPDWRQKPTYLPIAGRYLSARDPRHQIERASPHLLGEASVKDSVLYIKGAEITTVNIVGEAAPTDISYVYLNVLLESWHDLYSLHIQNESVQLIDPEERFVATITAGAHHSSTNRDPHLTPNVSDNTPLIRETGGDEDSLLCGKLEQASPAMVSLLSSSGFFPISLSPLTRTPSTIKSWFQRHLKTPPNSADNQLTLRHSTMSPTKYSSGDHHLETYLQTVTQTMSGRCCFTTEKSAFGMGPADMQTGDVVVSFPGGRTPFILREVEREFPSSNSKRSMLREKQYILLGDCYFHDMEYDGLDLLREFQIV